MLYNILLSLVLFHNSVSTVNPNISNSKQQNPLIMTDSLLKQGFIDKFHVPRDAKAEFVSRMRSNINFIKTLNGFVKNEVYWRIDENGDLIFMTIVVWENAEVLKAAKKIVQDEYKRIGFNPAEFFQKLNIRLEREEYQEYSLN